jgi:[ribosomal protein S5]-alanine N-acetyltransferase
MNAVFFDPVSSPCNRKISSSFFSLISWTGLARFSRPMPRHRTFFREIVTHKNHSTLRKNQGFNYFGQMISVRLATVEDYTSIVDYFRSGDEEFHLAMGVDSSKLPSRDEWLKLLHENHKQPLERKSFFYVIWMYNNEPIGHSNINKIVFGDEAYTHLHMWRKDIRQSGLGMQFMKLSIPFYFRRFELKNLFCEPYARNEAPNKTLKKLGFDFEREYQTIPGWISFHQPVNRWCMSRQRFDELYSSHNF